MTAHTLFADRYRLERRLGVGGMASVQLAMDTRLERQVAVKLLAEHLAADANFVSRSAARPWPPPGWCIDVVQVFDFGTEESTGRQYIVKEGVEARAARRSSRSWPPEPGEAVEILRQACRGLDMRTAGRRAPRREPGNLSWGARAARSSSRTSASPRRRSSPTSPRWAPCSARRPTSRPSRRGEWRAAVGPYALGVVACSCSPAGCRPRRRRSPTSRGSRTPPPPALHELDPAISPASPPSGRALERDPADRFADAAAMEAALGEALRGVAPSPPRAAEETEATRMLDPTAVTTPLARTTCSTRARGRRSSSRRGGGLEPIAEPPAPARAGRRPPRPPAQRRRPRRRRAGAPDAHRRRPARGVAAGAFVLVTQGTERQVQLKEDVQGGVEQSVRRSRT